MVDLRTPARVIRHHPGFSLAIIVLFALGTAAISLILTATLRLVLDPIRVPNSRSLVRAAKIAPNGVVSTELPYAVFTTVEHGTTTVEDVSADMELSVSYRDSGLPQAALAHLVSENYFALLNVAPFLGRPLLSIDPPTRERAIVLSYNFWKRYFGNKSAIGKTVLVQAEPFVIVGVMPHDFYGASLESPPDFWIPIAAYQLLSDAPLDSLHMEMGCNILARLRPGATTKAATDEFESDLRTLTAARPDLFGKEKYSDRIVVEPIDRRAIANRDEVSRTLLLLLSAISVGILVIVANMAGLFAVHAAFRQHSTAIRLSLGVSRRQMVVDAGLEACTLTLLGAAVGLGLASLAAPEVLRWLPIDNNAAPISIKPDLHVIFITIALAVGIGMLLALISVLLGRPHSLSEALRGRAAINRARITSQGLVLLQIALTVLLTSGAILLTRTLNNLASANPGFNPDGLAVFTLDASLAGIHFRSPALPAELLDAVRSLPAVQDAGFAVLGVMKGRGSKTSAVPSGQKVQASQFMRTSMNIVSPSYFSTLEIPLVAGRGFLPTDASKKMPAPVLVNVSLSRALFPGRDALGQHFGVGMPGDVAAQQYEIVGIVGDAKYRSMREAIPPTFYVLFDQQSFSLLPLSLYVRSRGDMHSVVFDVQTTLNNLAPELPFGRIETMHDVIAESLWQERLLASLGSVFALLALLVSAYGLYSLVAYDIAVRTRELAIRIALGAQRLNVLLLLTRRTGKLLFWGIVTGVILLAGLKHILYSYLYGVHALDIRSLLYSVAIVVIISCIACGQPLLRLFYVTPSINLRDE